MSALPLKITIPGYYDREIAYVLHVWLVQHLGITQYELQRKANTHFVFEGPTGKFVIQNSFFKDGDKALFDVAKIPNRCIEFRCPAYPHTLCTLFGDNQVEIVDGQLYIGADMVASSFLLLTQWDAALGERDQMGRIRLHQSVIGKFGLYQRGVVNEYIAFIRYLLNTIGISSEQKSYQAVFSCDVDTVQKYARIRNLAGAIYHSDFRLQMWNKLIKDYVSARSDIRKDPYFSFEYIIAQLQKNNTPAIFYFMTGKTNAKYDHIDYDVESTTMKHVFKLLQECGYEIGLHPSFESWKSEEILNIEKVILERAIGREITSVRQHYLRYEPGKTWAMQEKLGFETDSSVQFTEGLGFAAGICTPYKLYDLPGRRMMHIEEQPLILMKKKDYVKNVDQQYTNYTALLAEARKHNGRFQVLFHNSDVETDNEKKLFEATRSFLTLQ